MQKLTKNSPKKSNELKLVETHGELITTTSLLVAEKFKKRHDHVLEKIRNLQCSTEFHSLNFRESFYLPRQRRVK
jgi:Rha family phage regulatory protein